MLREKRPATGRCCQLYIIDLGITDAQVTTTGQNVLLIRSSFMDETTANDIVEALQTRFNDTVTVRRSDSVGPTIGREVATRAAVAVGVAALAVIIYITLAFRGVPHCLPLWHLRHHRHDPRCAGRHQPGGDRRAAVWLAGRLALPDRPADRDRLLGAGQDRGVRPHPREQRASTAACPLKRWSTTPSSRPCSARSTPS